MRSAPRFHRTSIPALAVGILFVAACDGQFLTDPAVAPSTPAVPAEGGGAGETLQYTISWDDNGTPVSFVVTPVETAGSVEAFYGYDGASANTGLEVSDEGTVLLHRDTNTGLVSLVAIYDAAGDGTGGSITTHLYDFTNGFNFPVTDDDLATDPNERPIRASGTGVYTFRHDWSGADTDGLAARDGFEQPFTRGMWFRDPSGLSAFNWVTGDGTRIPVPFGSSPSDRITLTAELVATDASPPTITAMVTGTLGDNDWYTSDVTVTWTVEDPDSDISSTTGCDEVTVDTDTDGVTFTCEATSDGGTASASVTVKRDASPPVVAFSGNAGSYDLDDPVAITCAATDATSGIASESCDDVSGPAWSFGPGLTELAASATDNAGNEGSAESSFEVRVTTDGMCSLIQDWVSSRGVANALCSKLRSADRSNARGRANASAGQLGAFVRHVNAVRGKWLTEEQADLLIEFAEAL